MQKLLSLDTKLSQDYAKNTNLSIHWNRWLLKTISAWPSLHEEPPIQKCFSRLSSVICYSLISFLFVPYALYLILEVEGAYNKLRTIGPLSFFVMNFAKYYLLIRHKHDYRQCFDRIEWDWKNINYTEDRNIMMVYANYGRKFVTLCTFFVGIGFVFFNFILPPSAGKITVEEENLTYTSLPFPFSKYIADVRYSPMYEIVFFVQCIGGIVVQTITATACCLAAVFVCHACGQMKVLMNWLEHLINGRADMSEDVDGRIANIVEHHVRILQFMAITEKSLQQISFIEFLGCTVNMCLLGYYTIMEWNNTKITFSICYLILIASFVFNIFVFCYIGELVVGQCDKIGEVSYMIEWYRLPGNKKLCCVLFIAMSNLSIKFTAGNMIVLSLSTFGDVSYTELIFSIHKPNLKTASVGKITVDEENFTYTSLPFPFSKYIADVRYSPMNEIVFFVQCVGGILLQTITATACCLAAVFVCHACGQMEVLMNWLEHLIDARADMSENLDGRIANIVEHHVRILQFMAITEKSLQQISFVEFLGCSASMCLLGYYTIMEWNDTKITFSICYLILIASFVFNIFLFCYIGELVVGQCDKIGEVSYMIEWYRLPGKKRLCCVLFIAMSNSSIKFTAGNMVGLSLSTFGDVSYTELIFPIHKPNLKTCPVYTKLMDVRFSPANEIVFGLQFLSGFVVNSITVGACGMAAFLAMHACGQLNVVTTKLDKLVNTDTGLEEEKIAQRKLGLIVEHHLRTLSFVWYIEKVMHLICLVELVGCTLNMCMLEYYILTEKSKQTIVSYSILYAAMTFNIFIFCYIGEILTEECKKVGERVYLTEWHRLHYKTMRGLIMIISRSNMVIKITAGKLMQMSIATLGDKKSAQALCSIVHRVRGNLDSVEFLRRCGTLAMTIQSIYVSSDLDNHSDYSLQLNRLFLKPIGAWPASPSTTTFDRILSIVLNIICYSSILLAFAPCFLNMLLEDESFYMKLKSLGPVSHWFVSSVNYTTLLLRGKDIRYCVEHMEADWRTVTRKKDQEVMLKNAKLGRYVATFCAAFMQGGVLCFCFVTAFSTQVIRVGNETRIVHVLPCAVYKKLVNVDESPTNEIVLFIQIWAAFVANCSTVGIFSLAAVLAAHACGQLSVVMTWIEEFVYEGRNRNGEAALKEFGAIVERHLKALNFISCIEEVMNRICLLELLRCTMDVCVIGYYVLAEWDDHDVQNLTTYFMMLFSICFNIFILCYIGEILTEQSKKVGEVVYMTNWYYLPEKRILDLILIIVRSSVVVKITAGKIVHMSIYTFSDVIKTGCAYLNLLREISR